MVGMRGEAKGPLLRQSAESNVNSLPQLRAPSAVYRCVMVTTTLTYCCYDPILQMWKERPREA